MDALPTIYALASAPGRAAIAVWRLSGPKTRSALEALTRSPAPPPRHAALRHIADPAHGHVVDRALVLWFPGPASFTGEDSAEIHTHGGRAVAEAMMAALAAVPGLRAAEPGEFSRHAFLNGKLDLTEAEAIADLAAAETEAQRRQALVQAEGGLARLYDHWRARLIRARAQVEAELEFPDEEIGDPLQTLWAAMAELRAEIARHLADSRRGEQLRGGVRVAVLGAPNTGKSSLVNALARRDVAIVAAEPGTTRDVIEAHLDLGGYPVTIADTAGLRDGTGAVEAEGIARAHARAAEADIVLALFDATAEPDAATLELLDARAIAVRNKIDLVHAPAPEPQRLLDEIALSLSIKTGEGLDRLIETLTARVADLVADSGAPPPTRARHRDALERTLAAFDRARAADALELAAEDLRAAADALGRISGRIDVEDMLDAVFRDFCIGK